MALITSYYGIGGPVPFLDVDVCVDNRWFLDPHAVRLNGRADTFARQAVECLDTFFGEVLGCVLRGDAKRGLWLLQRFVEPWETRLGYAHGGFSGHGGAQTVGSWIWRTLNHDLEALTAIGLLRHLEDLPVFVEGIDKDITSDIATRVTFEALAGFTNHMVDSYPQFSTLGHHTQMTRCQAWDVDTRDWVVKPFRLPIAAGKPLLLVPRRWVRPNLLMSANRYYDTTVLDYIQLERSHTLDDGKVLKTPKVRLMKEPGIGRGRHTNRATTQRAHDNNEDLLASFKRFVDMKAINPSDGGSQAA